MYVQIKRIILLTVLIVLFARGVIRFGIALCICTNYTFMVDRVLLIFFFFFEQSLISCYHRNGNLMFCIGIFADLK